MQASCREELCRRVYILRLRLADAESLWTKLGEPPARIDYIYASKHFLSDIGSLASPFSPSMPLYE